MIGPSERRFRDRAEEARSLAEQMQDPDLKQQMLEIAEDFDRYAESAARLDMLLASAGTGQDNERTGRGSHDGPAAEPLRQSGGPS